MKNILKYYLLVVFILVVGTEVVSYASPTVRSGFASFFSILTLLVYSLIVACVACLLGWFCSIIYGKFGLWGITTIFAWLAITKLFPYLKSLSAPVYKTVKVKKWANGNECWDGWITSLSGAGRCSHHSGVKTGYVEIEKTVELSSPYLFYEFVPFVVGLTALLILCYLNYKNGWAVKVQPNTN